jgi:lipopolysaccharide transport system ATP-binding protein
MVMRLAFSIAIFSKPDVFIVDEALSVGDAHFQQKCTKALKEKKASNMSLIYVSHDLNSLKILCDRLILLDKGRVIKEGIPEDVINYYNFLIANKESVKQQDKSFGNYDVEILQTEVIGKESKSNCLTSGEEGVIRIKIKANKDIKNATVGILIRDRFGQDIFGTNTYYHNVSINLKKNQILNVEFDMKFNLGVGKYTLTVAVHDNETHVDNCYHWVDFAAEFEIAVVKGAIFNGLCRLEPIIKVH